MAQLFADRLSGSTRADSSNSGLRETLALSWVNAETDCSRLRRRCHNRLWPSPSATLSCRAETSFGKGTVRRQCPNMAPYLQKLWRPFARIPKQLGARTDEEGCRRLGRAPLRFYPWPNWPLPYVATALQTKFRRLRRIHSLGSRLMRMVLEHGS
jgi:hypothetical protein